MSRALVYLGVVSWKNSLRRKLRRLREPRHLLTTLLLLGLFGMMAWGKYLSRRPVDTPPGEVSEALGLILSVLMITMVVNGFLQRGVAFDAAEVDMLLPAPFARGTLLTYKIVSGYPTIVITATIIQFMFGGFSLPNPWLGYAGTLLFFAFTSNLSAVAGLLASRVRRGVWSKLVRPLRVLALVVLLGGLWQVMPVFLEQGGIRGILKAASVARVTQALFAPAFAAANLGVASGISDAWPSIAILLGGIAGALALARIVGSSLVEWPVAERYSRRGRRAGDASAAPSAGLPRLPIFRGSGALLWKNLLVARRSWVRITLGVLIVGGFVALPMSVRSGGSDPGMMVPYFAAMVPLFLGETLGFDFRREMGHLAELKMFPARPMAIAAAEIGASTILGLMAQALILAVAAAVGVQSILSPWVLAVGFPPLTFGLFALENLAALRHPRSKSAGLLEFFVFCALAFLPAALAGTPVYFVLHDRSAALMTASVVQAGVDVLLLWLVARAFARIDVSRDLPGSPVPVG